MKKKRMLLPIIALLAMALVLGACGNDNSSSTGTTTSNSGQNNSASNQEQAAPEQNQENANQPLSWSEPPAMEIDENKSYSAEVTTSKGTFTIELFAKDAPITVNNFVFLSKQGYYDNVIFHRIMESFMIQTGDPLGNGTGGPGYRFEDETEGSPYQYEPGIVAMANAGPDTNGSQFFICTGDDSLLLNNQPNYTIFGKITDGMDVVKQIAATPVEVGPSGEMSSPTEKVTIESVKINES